MHVTAAVKQRVETKLKQCIALIDQRYKVKLAFPRVVYKKRGTVAGTASYNTWTIDLNPVLLMENVDDFIARTVPHELAHLACDKIYPEAHNRGASMFAGLTFTRFGRPRRAKREVHGPRWQEIMRALGADPSRCHSYDVENARVKKGTSHDYECPRCSKVFSLGPKRHAKAQRGMKYWHPGCGSSAYPLRPVGSAKPTPVAKPIVQPTMVQPSACGTKQERALAIYRANRGLSRAQMIDRFVADLGMTKAGASTYYYNCQKAG